MRAPPTGGEDDRQLQFHGGSGTLRILIELIGDVSHVRPCLAWAEPDPEGTDQALEVESHTSRAQLASIAQLTLRFTPNRGGFLMPLLG